MTSLTSGLPDISPTAHPFDVTYRVRIDDCDPTMTVTLAGVARYLQDIAMDMIDQSPFGATNPFWILRRNIIDVIEPITWPGDVDITRWCSASSTRWVDMRQRITGTPAQTPFNPDVRPNGHIETESFCINVTRDGRPARITDDMLEDLNSGVTETRLRWHSMNPTDVPDDAATALFPLRAADFDMFEHMNNAAYWHAVESQLTDHRDLLPRPHRAVIEYLKPVPIIDHVTIRSATTDHGVSLWIFSDQVLCTTVTITAL
ncbi:acyl-ACP thioesterase domain-containing protein [Gordonia sp. NB41Y]|uniref:acyl-[acyl-carrier-protein] thioesterase n=1 Tax=Gordonia sp. NB41Y TaxID=875808 RepID=UPI0002BDDAFC|nr:acyl-ACP thioesterase domain-containing protein [Gordonia sp. NB41Y]EMP12304.1 hypothetical protein ISGA_2842 [Gordonia sp. NB41Y]WLP90782.1 thioesterase [Gordonia sp. NB41Y]